MKKRTIVDIRQDGPHIVPDLSTTMVHRYDPELLARLSAKDLTPANMDNPLFKGGVCAGLGAFFDALIAKDYPPATVNELLWAAYGNLKAA